MANRNQKKISKKKILFKKETKKQRKKKWRYQPTTISGTQSARGAAFKLSVK